MAHVSGVLRVGSNETFGYKLHGDRWDSRGDESHLLLIQILAGLALGASTKGS